MACSRHWLIACGALGMGELTASFFQQYSGLWPFFLLLTVLAALFTYGIGMRAWLPLVLALLGMTLFLRASLPLEEHFRRSPWLRNSRQYRCSAAERKPVCREIARRLDLGLDHNRLASQISHAILLGERSNIPREIRELFAKSGTMHVFAISGLHVMLVARFLLVAGALLLLPSRWAGILALVPLWGYVFVIGLPPSAVRAASMASFGFLAPVFGRRPDHFRSWAITFLIAHLWNPRLVLDVGSVLSFVVMLAILVAAEQTRSLAGWKATAVVALSAWVVGLPISAHVFGRITPGGLLVGVPLAAVAQAAVLVDLLGLACGVVSDAVAAHLNNFAALLADAMVGMAWLVVRLPGACLETEAWPIWTCAAWYVALGLLMWLWHRLRSRHLI